MVLGFADGGERQEMNGTEAAVHIRQYEMQQGLSPMPIVLPAVLPACFVEDVVCCDADADGDASELLCCWSAAALRVMRPAALVPSAVRCTLARRLPRTTQDAQTPLLVSVCVTRPRCVPRGSRLTLAAASSLGVPDMAWCGVTVSRCPARFSHATVP